MNTSAREEAETARRTIENWFGDYPREFRSRWLGDFRSHDDGQHESAFFELFLFKFFQANLCKRVEIEPDFEWQKGAPDFLVETKDGMIFVVEAISPNYRSDEVASSSKISSEIRDAINEIALENHYIVLEKIIPPSRSIKKNKIKISIENWIKSNPKKNEKFIYKDSGCYIKISLIESPNRDLNSLNYRAIGIEVGGVSTRRSGEEIKMALEKKANKYRSLGMTYIIALNARSIVDTEDDYISANYGTNSLVFDIGRDGIENREPNLVRNNDGLFNDGGRARKANVSAVLIFDGIKPWQWRDRKSSLIHNAFAKHPLGALQLGGDAWCIQGSDLCKIEGRDVGSIFDAGC
ncbi:hypothetical protein [Erythrobacter fulvus]|uniref:hypothetical protein n=1 Tax=Erythrobacter fulvus TaxID=2987523 RepID=UPI00235A46DF|nr:hypothetical protein [Erythrobacter fulvus]